MKIYSAKDLVVYKKAYNLAMEIFELSKKFPREEKFAIPLPVLLNTFICLFNRD